MLLRNAGNLAPQMDLARQCRAAGAWHSAKRQIIPLIAHTRNNFLSTLLEAFMGKASMKRKKRGTL